MNEREYEMRCVYDHRTYRRVRWSANPLSDLVCDHRPRDGDASTECGAFYVQATLLGGQVSHGR